MDPGFQIDLTPQVNLVLGTRLVHGTKASVGGNRGGMRAGRDFGGNIARRGGTSRGIWGETVLAERLATVLEAEVKGSERLVRNCKRL